MYNETQMGFNSILWFVSLNLVALAQQNNNNIQSLCYWKNKRANAKTETQLVKTNSYIVFFYVTDTPLQPRLVAVLGFFTNIVPYTLTDQPLLLYNYLPALVFLHMCSGYLIHTFLKSSSWYVS